MRIFIIEPSAINFDRSHGAKSLVGHTRALVSAGMDVIWVTNVNSEIDYPGVRNYKALKYTIYDDVRKKRKGLYRRLLQPFRLLLALKTSQAISDILLKEEITIDDHIFIPTTDWITFRSVFRAIRNRKLANSTPKLHFLIMYDQARWMTGGYPFNEITKKLRNSYENVFVYTETARMATRLSGLINKNVYTYPFPGYRGITGPGQPDNKKSVCFLGGGRRDKGFQLIPEIVKLLNQEPSGRDLVIVVQAPRPEDLLEEELVKLKQYENVRVLNNTISEDEYNNCLKKCSILVFPYDKRVYESRGSAIVVEAVVNGIPLICTENTSLTELLDSGNGRAASTAEEFSQGILEIAGNYQYYSDRAEKASEQFYTRLLNSPLIMNIKGSKNKNTSK